MDNPNNNNIPAPFPNDPSTGSSPPAYNQHLPLITRPRARSLARPGSEIQHHSAIPVRAQVRTPPPTLSTTNPQHHVPSPTTTTKTTTTNPQHHVPSPTTTTTNP
ncbi:unnamed protein product [Rotaria sordida]|uniref:Uncharacterized protein n=1 Tax=Rotaria sordida TaxID=392033 RepID=A0A819X140_9BILA|nr:unnamed protein product [Rotaria sordida]